MTQILLGPPDSSAAVTKFFFNEVVKDVMNSEFERRELLLCPADRRHLRIVSFCQAKVNRRSTPPQALRIRIHRGAHLGLEVGELGVRLCVGAPPTWKFKRSKEAPSSSGIPVTFSAGQRSSHDTVSSAVPLAYCGQVPEGAFGIQLCVGARYPPPDQPMARICSTILGRLTASMPSPSGKLSLPE